MEGITMAHTIEAPVTVEKGHSAEQARRMLAYRWVCYGILVLTYIFVYFDRVAPAVVAPELMKEFGLTATGLGILSSMYFIHMPRCRFPPAFSPTTWVQGCRSQSSS